MEAILNSPSGWLVLLVWLPTGLYSLAWIVEFVRFWRQEYQGSRLSAGMMAVGWGAHTLLVLVAMVQSPFSVPANLMALAWAAMVLNYIWYGRKDALVISYIFPPFAIAMLIAAAFFYGITPMGVDPALRSATYYRALLLTHIRTAILGHLLFALACVVSIAYLYQERRLKVKIAPMRPVRLPALGVLEQLNHRAITLGFFFFSLAIILGLLVVGLTNLPHRLFSFRQMIPTLTWLVYAAFLLVHDLRGRRGRFGAIWSIGGFIVVMGSLIFEISVLLE